MQHDRPKESTMGREAGSIVEDVETETLDGSLVDPEAGEPQDVQPPKTMSGGSRKHQDTTGATRGPGRFGTGTSED
jgi:hypothetical protein